MFMLGKCFFPSIPGFQVTLIPFMKLVVEAAQGVARGGGELWHISLLHLTAGRQEHIPAVCSQKTEKRVDDQPGISTRPATSLTN